MPEKNPRYPHWCRIIRKTLEDPMEDEPDFTPLNEDVSDDDYDPMGSDVSDSSTDANEQQDAVHNEETSEEKDSNEGCKTTVIYEGECRSYALHTTSDKGEVVTSERGLALPLNQDGWDERGLAPQEGDEVIVVHGVTHKEYGHVIDKKPATASFAGTHVTWRYGRN